MRLILQKDIKNLGKAGDRVQVKKGFARNFLLPGKLAFVMDESRAKEWRRKQRVIESMKKKAVLERKALLERLSPLCLVFERESRAEGRIFGSVSPAEISAALEREHGILVDKKDISSESLKTLGEHQALISLDSEQKGSLKILIRKKLSEKESHGREPAESEAEAAAAESPEAVSEDKKEAGEEGGKAEAADSSAAPAPAAEKPSPRPPKKKLSKQERAGTAARPSQQTGRSSKKARRFAGQKKRSAGAASPSPSRQRPAAGQKARPAAKPARKPASGKPSSKKTAASAPAPAPSPQKKRGLFSRLFSRKK